MKYDAVFAGVGGQGVLTAAAILAEAARREGRAVKQGELHGMSQRGGAVEATVRIAAGRVDSDLVARGGADLVVGLEPLEALRVAHYLSPHGLLLSATDPHESPAGYPALEDLHARIEALPRSLLIPALEVAKSAGAARAVNVVMLGAASVDLPIDATSLEACIVDLFASRSQRLRDANVAAFRAGREAATPAILR